MEPQQDTSKPKRACRGGNSTTQGDATLATARAKRGRSRAATVDVGRPVEPQYRPGWDEEFAKEWLSLEPALSDTDMRGAMYVSREHLPVITDDASLSAEAAEILRGSHGSAWAGGEPEDEISALSAADKQRVFDKLLEVARRIEEWGAPPILVALIEISTGMPSPRVAAGGLYRWSTISQIRAAIVPRMADTSWGAGVLRHGSPARYRRPVKAAIASRKKK